MFLGDRLYHHTKQDCVGVAIVVLRTRGEYR
jgi:hypothetical protein